MSSSISASNSLAKLVPSPNAAIDGAWVIGKPKRARIGDTGEMVLALAGVTMIDVTGVTAGECNERVAMVGGVWR
jgi:hypothetical protein